MNRPTKCFFLTGFLLLFSAGSALSIGEPKIEFFESILDFGHVGIDYKVYYNFKFFNSGTAPLEIESVIPSCDCSRTKVTSKVLAPGDTAFVRLEFGTRNYFGPTSQSFTVRSNDPERPELKIFYVSTVGRWLKGVKPDPIYLFFLPGHGGKKITIDNTMHANLKASVIDQADDYCSVKLLNDKADRGQQIELEVTAGDPGAAGTYDTNFRLAIHVPDNEKPLILTIPVKSVKY